MNVLILGKDPALFQTGSRIPNDTRKRHQWYAQELQKQAGAESSVRIISLGMKSSKFGEEHFPGLHTFPTQSLGRATFAFDIIRLIPKVLKKWKPDLITVQTPWEEGLVGYVLSKFLKVAFLPQLHFDIFSQSWLHENFLNWWRQKVAFAIFRRATAIRVVSSTLRDGLTCTLEIPESRIHVVPVSVDFKPSAIFKEKDSYRKAISQDLAGKPVVLFVGAFYYPKNLELWVEIAEQIANRISSARFVMVGDGPLLNTIKQRVKQSKVADRFFLPGKIGREELPNWYAAANVFLLTSSYEGFGRVIVEAFLSGLPVVSSRCGGPEALIKHGETGFLAGQDDKSSLVEATCTLLSDFEKSLKMGQAAKLYAEKNFLAAKLVQDLVQCWQRVGSIKP